VIPTDAAKARFMASNEQETRHIFLALRWSWTGWFMQITFWDGRCRSELQMILRQLFPQFSPVHINMVATVRVVPSDMLERWTSYRIDCEL
jgi:hypothetical protein